MMNRANLEKNIGKEIKVVETRLKYSGQIGTITAVEKSFDKLVYKVNFKGIESKVYPGSVMLIK